MESTGKRATGGVAWMVLAAALLAPGPAEASDELEPGHDYTPEGWTKKPSFVTNAGQLARNEHALVVYVDGNLFPLPVMVGYRYGIFYWWDVGVEVGGSDGVFQALLHFKMENVKTIETELFYWGTRLSTGYKIHEHSWTDDLVFDDRSWIFTIENGFALRLGPRKDKAVYLNNVIYMDFDMHSPRRQNDFYVSPANLGFETMINERGNLYIELGMTYSINGMQTYAGKMFENTWFPAFRVGVAVRSGDSTAIYHVPDRVKKKKGVE
jgi:hypothetical protein